MPQRQKTSRQNHSPDGSQHHHPSRCPADSPLITCAEKPAYHQSKACIQAKGKSCNCAVKRCCRTNLCKRSISQQMTGNGSVCQIIKLLKQIPQKNRNKSFAALPSVISMTRVFLTFCILLLLVHILHIGSITPNHKSGTHSLSPTPYYIK